jgi:hypothetical protein
MSIVVDAVETMLHDGSMFYIVTEQFITLYTYPTMFAPVVTLSTKLSCVRVRVTVFIVPNSEHHVVPFTFMVACDVESRERVKLVSV